MSFAFRLALVVILVGLVLASCRGGAPAPRPDPADPSTPPGGREPVPTLLPVVPVPAGETFASQAARGSQVFAARCAHCHGSAGQGKAVGGPALIGPGTLRTEPSARRRIRTRPFETAANVGGFISARMPPTGLRLPKDDAWAAAAFLLRENGIATDGPPLGPETGKAIPIRR